MKPTKQQLADFKADQKAMKSEIKSAKKDASKAKKTLKKNTKLIAATERELGHWYYREQQRSTAEGHRKLKHCCTVISAAEKEIAESTQREELSLLRVKALQQELKQKKKTLKKPETPDISIPE